MSDDVVGSLANKPAERTRTGMGATMAVFGVILGVVGGIVMGVASAKKAKAQDILDFSNALGGRDYATSPELQSAITMGHVGLGLLIFGGALLLCGLVVVALRR